MSGNNGGSGIMAVPADALWENMPAFSARVSHGITVIPQAVPATTEHFDNFHVQKII